MVVETSCDLQVRHYYYRLVRRMNKLLGPDLSLDAKNPKDTNAAMLRWYLIYTFLFCYALCWYGRLLRYRKQMMNITLRVFF